MLNIRAFKNSYLLRYMCFSLNLHPLGHKSDFHIYINMVRGSLLCSIGPSSVVVPIHTVFINPALTVGYGIWLSAPAKLVQKS